MAHKKLFTRQDLIDHCCKVLEGKPMCSVDWDIKRQEHEIFYRLLIGEPLWRVFDEEYPSICDGKTHIELASKKALPPYGGLALSEEEMWQVESYMQQLHDSAVNTRALNESLSESFNKFMEETADAEINHPWRTIWRLFKNNILHL